MPTIWGAYDDSGDDINFCSDIKPVLTLNTISSSKTTQVTK